MSSLLSLLLIVAQSAAVVLTSYCTVFYSSFCEFFRCCVVSTTAV
nr:MAG TPA: hypothetical protein [Caudoviricetes sp.]DAT43414.1 MAG TPA: hypothetical protein [Caudoviricetes sp.]